MNEVLHANIFFIIASIATVVFCIFTCFILYQVYKILKLARSILQKIESASEVVAQDVAQVRELVRGGGLLTRILNFILGVREASAPKRRRPKSDI